MSAVVRTKRTSAHSGIQIPIGQGSGPIFLAARFANRHALVTGATGTGKTTTLMTLAEKFSQVGVPVFLVDVKGDLAQLTATCPARMRDAFGERGEPFSLRVDSLGPDLVSRALSLSGVQREVLELAFETATAQRRQLGTLSDLQALLHRMTANHAGISARLGLVSPRSLGAIQRALIAAARNGGDRLFGRQTFDVAELLDRADDGRGFVTVLDAQKLVDSPVLYATTLLFILDDLNRRLPEVGDLEAPRLILCFDEAHLLFAGAPQPVLQRIERTIRLIRSKGVGLFFATHRVDDIPQAICDQLGNRIRHADWNDSRQELNSLAPGIALVSLITRDGSPQAFERVRMAAPRCVAAPPIDGWRPTAKSRASAKVERIRGTLLAAGAMTVGCLLFVGAVRLVLGV